ncbi:EAL domain-containing protein [Sporolactobacillus kofuensis]|nr:EAL domain-containing protein [Sporolactobacillus kofuensis]
MKYSDLFYRSLFDHNPDIVFYLDINGVITLPNERFSEFLGYDPKEIVLSKTEKFLQSDKVSSYIKRFKKVLTGEKQYVNTVLLDKNGKPIDFCLIMIPAKTDNRVIGVFVIAEDMTYRKLLEQSLEEAELKFKSLADGASFGIFIISDGKLTYGNPKLYEFLDPYFCVDDCLFDHIKPSDQTDLSSFINEAKPMEKNISFPFKLEKQDGTQAYFECHVKKTFYQNQITIVGLLQDVTKRKKAEDLTRHLADHDELTDLPNRRFFRKKLTEEIMISQTLQRKFAVMYLDMDQFKHINDTLGHPIGDQLLIQFSNRLSDLLDEDHFIARLSGDEFLVLVPNIVNLDQVIHLSNKIINTSEVPFLIEDYRLFVNISIGISIYPNDGDDSATLVRHADSALHKAKEKGQNKVQIHTSSMDIESYKLFNLESDLRQSLELNQFELYYQPKVDGTTHQIVGAEALIRWNHPKWGLVSPQEFIPLAEEMGMMYKIDRWIEQTVCEQNKAWQNAGLPAIPISINLSANRFLENNLMSDIMGILSKTGLDSNYLEVEIVESSLLENEKIVYSILDGLQSEGIRINLDDFGTGYSSLSYLKRFKGKINTLKIDKSFIDDLSETNEESSNFITKSIIELAHHLKMDVVAEGVETREQLKILQDFKCNIIQGYVFSKPVSTDEFAELLRNEKLNDPTVERQENVTNRENRRKYFRIDLDIPLHGSITLVQFHEKKVNLGKTTILIENIGLGGLRFLSDLRFGVDPSLTLEIETKILGKVIKRQGSVVWVKELKSSIFQYGFKFSIEENERTNLSQLLNKFAILLRNDHHVPDCDFITTDKYDFFKRKKHI